MTFFSIVSLILFLALFPIFYRLQVAKKELEKERELSKKLHQEREEVLSFMRKVGETFTENINADELLRVALHSACDSLQATGGAIFVLNKEARQLTARKIEGIFPPFFETGEIATDKAATKSKFLNDLVAKHPVPVGEEVIGQVAQSGKPVLIAHGLTDPRLPRAADEFMQIRNLVAVPLNVRNELLGVMALVNKEADGGESFNDFDLSLLESLADQVALSLNSANLYQALQEKEKMDRELGVAKDIQHLLFPTSCPIIHGFDLASLTEAATEVGGDYFDFIQIDAKRLGIVIADVSGKGVPGALIMTMARSIMRTVAPGNLSSHAVLSELNKQICKDIKPDMFISMLYMILDSHNRVLTFARAGHEPLLHYHAREKNTELMKGGGMVIGIDAGETFRQSLEEKVIKLEPNDVVVIYTDGVTEAKDKQGKEFGKEGLCDAIGVAAGGPAKDIVENIRERVMRHTGGTPQHDDLTLVVLKAVP